VYVVWFGRFLFLLLVLEERFVGDNSCCFVCVRVCVCQCVLCCNCVWFGWLYAHIADGIIKL
jgi:hypothetical protein